MPVDRTPNIPGNQSYSENIGDTASAAFQTPVIQSSSIQRDKSHLNPKNLSFTEDISNSFKSNPNTMATANVSIKYALEAIPIFDGQNIPLSHFIEGCIEAKNMLPSDQELVLVKVVRNKLRGDARRVIQGSEYNDLTSLCRFLKSVYTPTKTVYQLQGELGSVCQKSGESVLTYTNRIKDLGNRIIEAHIVENGGQMDPAFKSSCDKALVDCFLRGVHSDIENKIERQANIQGTMLSAIKAETEIKQKTALLKSQSMRREVHQDASREYERVHLIQNEPIICQLCNEIGHTADKCYKFINQNSKPKENFFQTNAQFQPNRQNNHADIAQIVREVVSALQNGTTNSYQSNSSLICNYCKNPGHTIANCRKREYNNMQQNQQSQLQNQGNLKDLPGTSATREIPQTTQMRSIYLIQDRQEDFSPRGNIPNLSDRGSRVSPNISKTLKLNQVSCAPEIQISCFGLKKSTNFTVTAKISLNLIKERAIAPGLLVNTNSIIQLHGVSNRPVLTLGQTRMNVFGFPTTFHIVPNDLPFKTEGIIGLDFLRCSRATISYKKSCLEWGNKGIPFSKNESIIIPAGSKTAFCIRIDNPERKYGYIPHLTTKRGIFFEHTLVTNTDGLTYIYAINTNHEDIELEVPVVKLQHLTYEEHINQLKYRGKMNHERSAKDNNSNYNTTANRITYKVNADQHHRISANTDASLKNRAVQNFSENESARQVLPIEPQKTFVSTTVPEQIEQLPTTSSSGIECIPQVHGNSRRSEDSHEPISRRLCSGSRVEETTKDSRDSSPKILGPARRQKKRRKIIPSKQTRNEHRTSGHSTDTDDEPPLSQRLQSLRSNKPGLKKTPVATSVPTVEQSLMVSTTMTSDKKRTKSKESLDLIGSSGVPENYYFDRSDKSNANVLESESGFVSEELYSIDVVANNYYMSRTHSQPKYKDSSGYHQGGTRFPAGGPQRRRRYLQENSSQMLLGNLGKGRPTLRTTLPTLPA